MPNTSSIAAPSALNWKTVMQGSNYDPKNDQQSSADSDLLGNSSNPMLQAQSVAVAGDTVYFYRVRMGTLNNGNASSSFYLALDLNGTGSFPTADMFVEARYSIISGNLKKAAVVFHKADFSGSNSGYSPSTTAWQSSSTNENLEYSLLESANTFSNVNAYIAKESTGSDLDGDANNDLWITFGFTLSQLTAWANGGFSGGSVNVSANNVVNSPVTGSSAMALFAFTSTSQTANGDIAGVNDQTANLNQSWTDLGLVINTTLDNLGSGAPSSPTVNPLTTADTTPVVTGTALLSSIYTDTLTVLINNVTYSIANSNLTLTRVGATDTYQWAVQVSPALASGTTYSVTATTTRTGSTAVSDTTSNELVIDSTLPPQQPSITSYADDVSPNTGNYGTGTSTNDTAPKIQGVLDMQLGTGDTLHVYQSTAGGSFTDLGTATVSGTSWYFQDTGLSNGGAYLYKAIVVNGTKSGVASNLFNLNVDTAAPTATVSITNYYDDVGGSVGNFLSGTTTDDNSYAINGTFPGWTTGQPLGNGEKVAVYRDAAFVGYGQVTPTVDSTGTITGYTWSYQENGLPQATYAYTAKVVDAAGNAGTLSSNFSVTVSLPIDVGNITLNEHSAYAVFTVKGTAGQTATLTLTSGTATGTLSSSTAGSDFVTTLQYSTDGSNWSNYSSSIAFATGSTKVYVRVPIVYSSTFEGPETFTLSATSAGTTATGTATILDDGTGNVYSGTVSAGILQTSGTAYDDRTVVVTSYASEVGQASNAVNEASNFAMFTVTANASEVVLLNVLDLNSGGYTANLGTAPAVYFSVNGGLTWAAYDSAVGITVPSGGSFKVRLSITAEQDSFSDNNETFALKASYSSNSSNFSTQQNLIKDDGTGTIFTVDGVVDTTTTKDLDAITTTVNIVSMTRDSASADFITNDGGANRIVSGSLSAVLGSTQILEVSFDAGTTWTQVSTFADATHWSITDPSSHSANWTIKARVKNTDSTLAGSEASQGVTYDATITTPTVALTTDTTDGVTNNNSDLKSSSAALTFNANDSDATRAYVVDGGSSNSTYTAPSSQGSHTVRVTDTDTAGNTAYATITFVLDSVAPVLRSATVNSTSLVLNYTEAGVGLSGVTPAAADYAVTVNATVVTPTAVSVNTTNKTVTLTLPSAVNSLDIVQVSYTANVNKLQDIAGNRAANLTAQTVVNTNNATNPATTVTIASMEKDSGAADFITKDGTASRTVSGALSTALVANEILEVSFDNGNTWTQVSTFADATHWSITDPSSHSANWTIKARVNNTSSTLTGSEASQVVTYDATITTPTVALTTDTTDGVTNNNSDLKSSSAALTFNANDSDATRAYVVDGGSSNSTYTAPSTQGSHTVRVTDTDTAGNTAYATITFVLDSVEPILNAATVNGTSLVLTYTESGVGFSGVSPLTADYSVTVNATSVTPSAVSVNTTAKTVTLTLSSAVSRSDVVAVSYSAGVNKVQDIAGNLASNLSAQAVTNNTALNVVSITSVTDDISPSTGLLDNPGVSNDTDLKVRVNLTGSGALAGDKLNLYDGTDTTRLLGSDYTLTSTNIANGYAEIQTGTLANGSTYTITARIKDPQGHQSLVSTNSFVETIDTTITTPTVALSTDSTDGDSNNNSDLKSSNAGLTFNTKDSDASRTYVVDGGSSSLGYTAPSAQGSHTVTVSDSDNAGNTATASITFVLDSIAPVLNTASVNSNSMVLTYTEDGVGFSGVTPSTSDYSVTVNTTPVTPTAVSVNATNKTVTLTLSSAVMSGDTVGVTYTPGVNKLQDIAGNLATALSAVAVTNSTPIPPSNSYSSSNTNTQEVEVTPPPPPLPPPPPPFTANLDPVKDTGALDNVTKEIKPEFTLNGGALLGPGRTAQLLDPSGSIVGKAIVTENDVSAGKINVPTPFLDDGIYTYTAQILDENGKVVASTLVSVSIVTDLDGVMPSVELAAKGGDSNQDGIPDWQQNNVAQLPMLSVNDYQNGKLAPPSSFGSIIAGSLNSSSPSGVKLQESAQLENIKILPLPTQALPNNAVAQTPLFDFTVTSQIGSQLADLDATRPGLQLQTVILLPANITANAYMKYDRISGNWFNLTNPASIDGSQDGAALIDADGDGRVDRIVITITDGGPGDEDGIVNGRVVDPGTLALMPPLITGPSGLEGSAISEKSIPENTLPVAVFKASEPVTWSISGGSDQNYFFITSSGELIFNKSPDYEIPVDANHDNAYLIHVKATNAQGYANVQEVTVKITDVLDEVAPFIQGPSGKAGDASSVITINENLKTVTTFTANEPATWSLLNGTGQDQIKFALDATTGSLSFLSAPDYEVPTDGNAFGRNTYQVQVNASDAAGNKSSQMLTVTIANVDEGIPVYAAPTTGTDRWLSLNQKQADALASKSSVKAQIDFYATSRLDSDTLHLSAWHNVVTGDYFYAPEDVAPPYACYVRMNDVELGRVLKPGKGTFDVHLYLNHDGLTQLVGVSQATQMGLISHGYSDLGVLFASAPGPDGSVGLVGVMPIA